MLMNECKRLNWEYLGFEEDDLLLVGVRTQQGDQWRIIETLEVYSMF